MPEDYIVYKELVRVPEANYFLDSGSKYVRRLAFNVTVAADFLIWNNVERSEGASTKTKYP